MEDKMLVLTGIFENDRLIPDNPVSIPQKKTVEVRINEIPATVLNKSKNERQAIFDKYRLDLSEFKFNRDEANDYD